MSGGVRRIFLLLVLAGGSGAGACWAEPASVPYLGRTVSAVLDEFRSQGFPFAYSTNLVDQGLAVTSEPTATDPLNIVSQILAPHQLEIRPERGLLLVVRKPADEQPTGGILLILKQKATWQPLDGGYVTTYPALPEGDNLASGIYEFEAVEPRRYRFVVEADGFEDAVRSVSVVSGQTVVIELALAPATPEIESITVSSSRYDISRDLAASSFFIDQRSIQSLPDLGDDPLRASHRLPGAASGGLSAKPHFRGGEENETGVILNGYELFDPFHARDFSNIFSVIDPRTVDGIDVFTGGFPVRYGDHMSGLVTMETIDPGEARRTEVGVSVFNTSLLSAGSMPNGRGRWLVSGRRGNLDLIVDPKYGTPSYADFFGSFASDLTPFTELSMNALIARDNISIVLADNEEEFERAGSDTRNIQIWSRLQTDWSADLSSSSLIYFATFTNDRSGIVDDPERIGATVSDVRDVSRYGFRQDWRWHALEDHFVQWGFEFGDQRADYDYRSRVEYLPTGNMNGIDRRLTPSPSGGSYAIHVSDKWRLATRTYAEAGLRWDDEDYTRSGSGPHLSPRVSIFHATRSGSEFRLSWGRYYQSAGINELQVEDGVSEFWPAQHADHIIAGLRLPLRNSLNLRLELYQKDIRQPRSRFENLFDPLELLPEVEPDRIRISPQSARARGVELMIDRRGDSPWSWWASYTLAEVADEFETGTVLRSWDQRHALQAGVNFSSESWNLGLAASVHSGWPTTEMRLAETSVEPGYALVLGDRNAQRFATFATLDLRAGRRFVLGDNLLTTFFELSNALNRSNPCCVDFDVVEDDDGRLTIDRQEDHWLPLLPSIGFLLEF